MNKSVKALMDKLSGDTDEAMVRTKPKPNIKHLSFSALTLFNKCPASYAAKYIDGLKPPHGEAAGFGNQFDQCLAQRHGHKTERHVVESEEVTKALDIYLGHKDAWTTSDEAQYEINITPDEWDEIAEYYGSSYSFPFNFLGYVDFIKDRQVMDVKTSTRSAFNDQWRTQVLLYCAMTHSTEWHVHLYNRKTEDIKVWSGHASKAKIKEVLDWAAFTASQIKMVLDKEMSYVDLPKVSNFTCRWCPLHGYIDPSGGVACNANS